jgi:MFS family permease
VVPTESDFRRFWAGQTISQFGSSFTQFATPLLIFQITGSAVNLGVATAINFIPYLLFGLVIGAWVDRLDRKRMMIAVDIGRAAVIATIPLLSALDALHVWEIYLVGFVSTTLTIFFDAGEFAAIPSLVDNDDLVRANGRIQASYSAASIAGPLLAGLLVTTLSVSSVFLFDAGSFAVSAIALALVRARFNGEDTEAAHERIRDDVVAGLRYVLRDPILRSISIMMALFNFVAATTNAQLVLFSKERLGATSAQVGFLFAAGSAGVMILGLTAGRVRQHLRFGTAALGSLLVSGAITVLFALNHSYSIALVLWAGVQGFGIFFNINTGSLRQAVVPNHFLGRVISIAGVLAWSAIPLGSVLGAYAIRWTGNVALVYAVIGVLECAIAAAFFVLSPLGHAEDYLPGTIGTRVEGTSDSST